MSCWPDGLLNNCPNGKYTISEPEAHESHETINQSFFDKGQQCHPVWITSLRCASLTAQISILHTLGLTESYFSVCLSENFTLVP